jgi:hypothetical protein
MKAAAPNIMLTGPLARVRSPRPVSARVRLPNQLSTFCCVCGTIAVSSLCCSGGRTCDHAYFPSSH